MALWEKSMHLQGPLLEQMKSLYAPRFPIEVRHYLATWMEQQAWSEIDIENPLHEQEARRLFENMLQALQDLIITYATDFIIRIQLEALYSHMSNAYYQHPIELVRVVQECLCKEQELVDKQDHLNALFTAHQAPSSQTQIQRYLTNILSKTEGMESSFREVSFKLENYILQHQEAHQIEAALQQGSVIPPDQLERYRQRKALLDQIGKQHSDEIKGSCSGLSQQFVENVEQIRLCQNLLVNQELANWSQSQRQFNWEDDRGKLELNTIQQLFEELSEVLWRNKQLAKQYEMFKQQAPQGILQPDQSSGLTQILTTQTIDLIRASFVVEKQPPQVIKTSNRFSAVARLLVGCKLNIHLWQPEVVVTIINDKQAKFLIDNPNQPVPPNFGSGEIMNNSKTMEYNKQNGIVSASFNLLQLRRVKRNPDKKSNEMVTEEKFTLLFRTRFAIGGELEVDVKTSSLPVVVIVHALQRPQAEVTIFWDNAFAEASREPFCVPVSVTWPQVCEALNCYFHAQTGRGLTPQNLDYLGRLLLGVTSEEDLSQKVVTRQQLNKDQMRGRNFTFWEWFYKHLDLVKTTLKREWVDGSIQGFVRKIDAENILKKCNPGTFLIRFSEGEPGGISVAWVTEGDVSCETQVLSLAPWNKYDLNMRTFADRLHDLTHLLYLYPNEPKDIIFGNYYSHTPAPSSGGYIPADLRASIPHHMIQRAGGSNPISPVPSIVSTGVSSSTTIETLDQAIHKLNSVVNDQMQTIDRLMRENRHLIAENDDLRMYLPVKLESTDQFLKEEQPYYIYSPSRSSLQPPKTEEVLVKTESETTTVTTAPPTEALMAESDATIEMHKEKVQQLLSENQTLLSQLTLSTPRKTEAPFYLPGVEVVGQTSVMVTKSEQSFHWTGYGFKLHIPQDSLPAGVDQCVLHISASIAGQYQFPDNMELVSAVYWIRCDPYCLFKKPLTAEFQHCAKMTSCTKLTFVRALCSQKSLPYTFKKVETLGSFTDQSSYGSLQLDRFSGIAVAGENVHLLYIAGLYYRDKNPRSMEIHFVITRDDEPHITEVKQHFQKNGAREGPYIAVEYEQDKISLDIPMPEGVVVDEWKIKPLVPPKLPQWRVDSFKPGRKIPSCQLKATLPHDQRDPIPERSYLVTLQGAKGPDNQMIIEIDPFNSMDKQTSGAHSLRFPNSETALSLPVGRIRSYLPTEMSPRHHEGYYYPPTFGSTACPSPYYRVQDSYQTGGLGDSFISFGGAGPSTMLSSDIPKTSLTFENLERQLKTIMHWHRLGTNLGIPQEQLEEIELNYPKVYSRKIALVKLIVGNHQFSWEDICTALEEMNETMLATQIRSKYCNEDTSHSESTSEDQSISGSASVGDKRKQEQSTTTIEEEQVPIKRSKSEQSNEEQ